MGKISQFDCDPLMILVVACLLLTVVYNVLFPGSPAHNQERIFGKELPLRFKSFIITFVEHLEDFSSSHRFRRAFNHFDYNHKGKVTRGQWQTTLATIRLETEASRFFGVKNGVVLLVVGWGGLQSARPS